MKAPNTMRILSYLYFGRRELQKIQEKKGRHLYDETTRRIRMQVMKQLGISTEPSPVVTNLLRRLAEQNRRNNIQQRKVRNRARNPSRYL